MAKEKKTYILNISMIPSEQHGKNLRAMLTKVEWDTLRIQCYIKANYRCELCNGKGKEHPVECHEDWEYNLNKGIQKLRALQAVCPMCHKVIHIGRAFKTGFGDEALRHHRKVNKIRMKTQQRVIDRAKFEWLKREEIEFDLDISHAKELLKEFDSTIDMPDDMTRIFK